MSALAYLLLVVGAIGLIVPILPGIPLLVLAALLFTAKSPGLRRRLFNTPRLAPYFRRLDALFKTPATPGVDGLTAWERAKLKTLSVLGALLPRKRR